MGEGVREGRREGRKIIYISIFSPQDAKPSSLQFLNHNNQITSFKIAIQVQASFSIFNFLVTFTVIITLTACQPPSLR